MLGVDHPTNTIFDDAQELIIQKAFFDFMWDIPLAEAMKIIGDSPVPPNIFDALAEKLNIAIAAHADELRSFKQAYTAEIIGVVSLYVATARRILEEINESALGEAQNQTEAQREARELLLLNLLVQAFKKSNTTKKLPTMHIHASLHAAVRWDKKRRLEGNDLYDFHHAAAALAYCNVFLTEKPLHDMLKYNHIALDKLYGCAVIFSISEAVEYFQTIVDDIS